MAKGLLNLWMLKILSEGEVSCYDIIKKVSKLTGKKPSTGSVYPLLKSMEDKGWITGKKVGNKTKYKITGSGREVVKSHGDLKDYYSKKIHESICLAHETFDDLHLASFNNGNLLAPLTQEISSLLSEGVELAEINKIIQNARAELKKLKKGGKPNELY
jgi:formylmethanofuran dehydrogenase subunit E